MSIEYHIYGDYGYLGRYTSEKKAIEYLDYMAERGSSWVNEGVRIEKVTILTERINLCR